MSLRTRRPSWGRAGIGLVEAVVATVIVGVMFIAAMGVVDATFRAGRVTVERQMAPALASHLLSEIMAQDYAERDAGWMLGLDELEVGLNRSAWDDVDDYNGLDESPPRNRTGAEVPGARLWRWQVAVQSVDPLDLGRVATEETGLKRIRVTVVDRDGKASHFTGLRSRNGPRDRDVSAETTFVGRVGVDLEVGGGIKGQLSSGVTLLNEPTP